jgi:hypothetical protein
MVAMGLGRLEARPGGVAVFEQRGLVSEEAVEHGVGVGHRRLHRLLDRGVEEALAGPMPDGETATQGVFADEPALLEDGNAPWSGFAAAKGA